MASFIRRFTCNPPGNCFPWEYWLRTAQLLVAIVLTIAISVLHQTTPTCNAPLKTAQSYVNTFCHTANWYDISNHSILVPAAQDIRSFDAFDFVLPSLFVVALIILMNIRPAASKCVKEAKQLAKEQESGMNGNISSGKGAEEGAGDVIMVHKERERAFIATWFIQAKPVSILTYQFPLTIFTSHRYFIYLSFFFLVNFIAAIYYHPGMFPFRTVIACLYHAGEGVPGERVWTSCVVHGIAGTRTCLWIVVFVYIINMLTCVASAALVFLSPRILLKSSKHKIPEYADDLTHETCLRDFARSNKLLYHSNTHAMYLMSLLWAHLGCDAASWLVVSYMDVLKDQRIFTILNEINKVFTVRVIKHACIENTEQRAYRTMIEEVSRNGERRSESFENMFEGKDDSEMGDDLDDEIPARLQQWDTMFCKDYEYSRNLFHLYKVSLLMEKDLAFTEIDHQPTKNSAQVRPFENSGAPPPFWMSVGLQEENWLERKWDRDYKLMLLAIQAPRQNVLAAPTKFTISVDEPASHKNSSSSERGGDMEPVPFDHTVESWFEDEWKVFALCGYNRNGELLQNKYPTGKAIKLTMLTNGGEQYYELQNLKIFGSPVEFASEAIKRTTVPLYDNGHKVSS